MQPGFVPQQQMRTTNNAGFGMQNNNAQQRQQQQQQQPFQPSSVAPVWSPPAVDRAYYETLFAAACPSAAGTIQGREAVMFLKKSGLAHEILRTVWALADPTNKGFLAQADFFVAMRLVSIAQQGNEISATSVASFVSAQLPLPAMEGFQAPPPPRREQVTSPWTPLAAERAFFETLFTAACPSAAGTIQGREAVMFLKKSGLAHEILRTVWALADPTNKGFLAQADFFVAMRLVSIAQQGNEISTTSVASFASAQLPLPAMEGFQSPTAPMLSTETIEAADDEFGDFASSAPETATATSNTMFDVAGSEDSSGLDALNALAGGADVLAVAETSSKDWDPTATERQFFERLFAAANPSDGVKIQGREAVTFLMKSGLPHDVLRNLWALADPTNQGYLTQAGFNVAMRLISIAQRGDEVTAQSIASFAESRLPLPAMEGFAAPINNGSGGGDGFGDLMGEVVEDGADDFGDFSSVTPEVTGAADDDDFGDFTGGDTTTTGGDALPTGLDAMIEQSAGRDFSGSGRPQLNELAASSPEQPSAVRIMSEVSSEAVNRMSVFDDMAEMAIAAETEEWDDFADADTAPAENETDEFTDFESAAATPAAPAGASDNPFQTLDTAADESKPTQQQATPQVLGQAIEDIFTAAPPQRDDLLSLAPMNRVESTADAVSAGQENDDEWNAFESLEADGGGGGGNNDEWDAFETADDTDQWGSFGEPAGAPPAVAASTGHGDNAVDAAWGAFETSVPTEETGLAAADSALKIGTVDDDQGSSSSSSDAHSSSSQGAFDSIVTATTEAPSTSEWAEEGTQMPALDPGAIIAEIDSTPPSASDAEECPAESDPPVVDDDPFAHFGLGGVSKSIIEDGTSLAECVAPHMPPSKPLATVDNPSSLFVVDAGATAAEELAAPETLAAIEFANSCSLRELTHVLTTHELLEDASACESHLLAKSEVDVKQNLKQMAIAEDRLEDAIPLREEIRKLEQQLASDEIIGGWRAAAAARASGKGGDSTLSDMRDDLVAISEALADKFASRYMNGAAHPALLADHAKVDLNAALRRQCSARRSARLCRALHTTHAAYGEYWDTALQHIAKELRNGNRIVSDLREKRGESVQNQVLASQKFRSYVRGLSQMSNVAKLVLLSADDAMHPPAVSRDELDALWRDFTESLTLIGMQDVDAATAVESPNEADVKARNETTPSGRLCNFSLAALPTEEEEEARVVYFSGAPYYGPCGNFWVNCVSSSPPVGGPLVLSRV